MEEKSKGRNDGIIGVLMLLWSRRKLLTINCVIGGVLAIVIAFSMPKQYTSSAVLAPEMTSGGGLSGGLGAIASMAGVNLDGMGNGNDALYPELYPQIVSSTPFLWEILAMPVESADGEIKTSLYEYLLRHQKSAWWTKIYSVPMNYIKGDEVHAVDTTNLGKSDAKRLSKQQFKVLTALDNRINVAVDKGNNVITIDVTMQDAKIAADVANAVSGKLQAYVEKYRSAKARKDLEYTEKLYKDAEAKYHEAQQAYAEYASQHQNVVNAKFQVEFDRLANEKDLALNMYTQMSQNLDIARARVQENTPVCVVMQPAYAPIKASFPKKIMMGFLFVFMAFFGTSVYIILKDKIVNR